MLQRFWKKSRNAIHRLGPGLITGAADDDPSGIATYTQTGAQFGYGQLWTVLLLLPFITGVQEACARIGAVTGQGLASVIKQHYSKNILYSVVILVLLANTINIGADIGAMAAAMQLLIPLPFALLTITFTFLILMLQIFTSYEQYAKILKWLALALLSYVITVFIVQEPWQQIAIATVLPHIEFSFNYLFLITAVFGTTISPYLFFWEAAEEVEEEKMKHLFRENHKPHIGKKFIHAMRWDNFSGMLTSQAATWCIIVVAGTVLHAHGITTVNTAADAAKALEPLVQTFPYAGFLAKLIFALGIIGLGLLAIPVLSTSAAYTFSETIQWHEGLSLKFKQAHGFYGVIIVATLLGLLLNLFGVDPVKMLIFAAVFNGIAAAPLLFLIAKIASNKKIMGQFASKWLSKSLVWITFGIMSLTAISLLLINH